jgi:hypothetical protein
MSKGSLENLNIGETIGLLIESLCHKIRTPLSVVSNDLKYFETTLGKEETSRSLRRIDEIKNTLKECAEFLNIGNNPISAAELCQSLGIPSEDLADFNNLTLPHGEKLKLAGQYLKKLLSEFELTAASSSIFKVESLSDGLSIYALVDKGVSGETRELLVFKELGMEGSPLSALTYILLKESGAQISLSPEGESHAKITITLFR